MNNMELLQKLRDEIEVMKKLANKIGFFSEYIEMTYEHNDNCNAFYELNNKYYKLFKRYKYQSCGHFSKAFMSLAPNVKKADVVKNNVIKMDVNLNITDATSYNALNSLLQIINQQQ